MGIFDFIIWSVNPEIFPNIEKIPVRWYGLLFAMAFIVGQQILYFIYRKEGRPEKDVDIFTLFILIATILGARLGHVFFYEPAEYLKEPLNIFKIWEGGLASHGAAIGIILGVYLYCKYDINLWPPKFKWKKQKRKNQDFFWVIDRLVILVALGGCFIRLGNYFNSEIIGKPTDSQYGVVFAAPLKEAILENKSVIDVKVSKAEPAVEMKEPMVAVDLQFIAGIEESQIQKYIDINLKYILINYHEVQKHFVLTSMSKMEYEIDLSNKLTPAATIYLEAVPRHPTQLYEAGTSLLIFIILFLIWYKKQEKLPRGLLFALFLIILFGFRFVHEMFKENQVDFENTMSLNMGQILSIPMILAGIVILLFLKKIQPKEKDN